MDTEAFFRAISPLVQNERQSSSPRLKILRQMRISLGRDPCPDVAGMASIKKLKLLNLAARCLPKNSRECYLEVGSFQGKSLVAALIGNSHVHAVACDNFTLFDDPNSPRNFDILKQNLARYQLSERVQFFDCDFREVPLVGTSGDCPELEFTFMTARTTRKASSLRTDGRGPAGG